MWFCVVARPNAYSATLDDVEEFLAPEPEVKRKTERKQAATRKRS